MVPLGKDVPEDGDSVAVAADKQSGMARGEVRDGPGLVTNLAV